MAYATVQQYEDRYGEVADEAMLGECLDECSVLIDAELDRRGIDHASPSESYAQRLMMACRSMARRVMPSVGDSDIPVGATQASYTAGPYNQQFTLPVPYGTPRVGAYEMRLLGIGARIGFGALAGGGDD